jgi:hypothetical protein
MTSTWVDIPQTFAINDQFTEDTANQIAANLDFLRNPPADLYAPSTAASNITTTSTSLVAISGYSLSVTTQGGKLKVEWCVRANSTNMRFDVVVDGISVTADSDGKGAVTPASTFGLNTGWVVVDVAAGLHTVVLQWRVTTGTGTLYPAGLSQFLAYEIGNVA